MNNTIPHDNILDHLPNVNYINKQYLQHFRDRFSVKHVMEVGARDGNDSILLSLYFSNAKIYAFECNPDTVVACKQNIEKFTNGNIILSTHGLGDKDEILPFYSFRSENNPGASSFLRRYDGDRTQVMTGTITIKPLSRVTKELNIPYLDLLCMDVQGYELNILKGCKEFLSKIHYIILEAPNGIKNNPELPEGSHSKYIAAPSLEEIIAFMNENGFIPIELVFENLIENNIMFLNTRFES
jgi:FkbM family methyltransferase